LSFVDEEEQMAQGKEDKTSEGTDTPANDKRALVREKTVLIVEDEPDVRLFLQVALEDAGFNVLTAEDGEIAWKLIKENKPDVISLDLILPKISGRKLLRALQDDEKLSRIPVLIVTAHADDGLGTDEEPSILESIRRPRSLKQGPGMFLRKPVTALDYVHSVEQAAGIESDDETDERLAVRADMEELIREASPEALKAALEVLRKKR